jgi:heme-degrading monooxygenase HmoA
LPAKGWELVRSGRTTTKPAWVSEPARGTLLRAPALFYALARAQHAEDYAEHLRTETFPQLRTIAGFAGAQLLKRRVDQGVEFLVVTQWQSLEAIQRFAGADVEAAVVPDKVQQMMLDYERRVRHYEVVIG